MTTTYDPSTSTDCPVTTLRPALRAIDEDRWLPVADTGGLYEISDAGHLRSWRRYNRAPGQVPHLVSGSTLLRGYKFARFRLADGTERRSLIHALVLEAFVGPRPDGLVIRHLNGDPADNRLANLTYGTPSENNHDAVRHGTHGMSSKTACKKGHPFDETNTIYNHRGARVCRTCRNARALARYHARKAVSA